MQAVVAAVEYIMVTIDNYRASWQLAHANYVVMYNILNLVLQILCKEWFSLNIFPDMFKSVIIMRNNIQQQQRLIIYSLVLCMSSNMCYCKFCMMQVIWLK